MSDTKTTLNVGVGGSDMDESLVTTTLGPVHRTRVVPGGDGGELQSFDSAYAGRTAAHVEDLGFSNYETRLDYDVRTDSNPVYVGFAVQGTATSASTWAILKLIYDGSNRLTRKEVLLNVVWNNRASLGW